MIKITIDENVLTLTPRTKKIGKRLLWGWLSLQILTLTIVLGTFAFMVGLGIYTYYEDLEFERQQATLSDDSSGTRPKPG